MAAFITMGATDSYFNGLGRMHIKFMSLFTLQDASGYFMNQASLERMLTECLLIPSVLFDKNIITWEKAGADSAYAVIKDGGIAARALVMFNTGGSLKSIRLSRNREENKALFQGSGLVIRGEFKDYNGYKLPSYMEGAWIADGKEQLYVKFKTDNAVYYPAADATNKEAQAH